MNILGFNITRGKEQKLDKPKKPRNRKINIPTTKGKSKTNVTVPAGRVSSPGQVFDDGLLTNMKGNLKIIKPDFLFDSIPLIRKLYKVNEDLGLALFDLIQLTNTGHTIKFSQNINPEMVNKMRAHLKKVSVNWHTGAAGIDGLINKWIAQIYIGGALSTEWVVNKRLTGIQKNVLVNPETIRFGIKDDGTYKPYQKTSFLKGVFKEYIPLNENTYQYIALLNDEDTPYGVPPFLTALNSIGVQKSMKDNLAHIMDQMGLLGYLETKIDKPEQMENESQPAYYQRLKSLLSETKTNMIRGFKEGIVVGYQEDHEFNFHATTKNLAGVSDIFSMNENQIANGLKTSPSFLGVKSGSSESFLSIVFTKNLSQLKNVQQVLEQALQKGYELELMLAGFDYGDNIKVEFKPSTITDDLKTWQAKEIKQRVLRGMWIDRIISSEQYAEDMGYVKPHKVVEPPEPGSTNDASGQKKKEDREADKDKSDRKSRDKNKTQPKRKDTDTKPR